MKDQYLVEVHASIKQLNWQEWQDFVNPKMDLAMDPRLLNLMESTLSDQAKFWIILIRNPQQQLIACACLSLFRTDIIQSSNPIFSNVIKTLRHYFPNILKMKVLYCGLPLPSGHSHLRMKNKEDSEKILLLIHQNMLKIAQEQNARLMVFKELDGNQDLQLKYLKKWKYSRGQLQPVFHLLKTFEDFSAYENQLRSGYRYQIKCNKKKFNKAGLIVEHFVEPEQISNQFTEQVYQLYLNVWTKAKEKLECFSIDFFRELPNALPKQVLMTLIKDKDVPVAFAIGMIDELNYYNLYVGLDYQYLKEEIYCNLFYHELDHVFRLKKNKILLGQTSAVFKSRLGAIPDSRYFWVLPLKPSLQMIFKCFHKLIFPKEPHYGSYQVFKTE
ncbi:MAG: GNAT family N-acetyltransferase [Proteobacteria bacterium]|nr:GNAT family N-acetyltransferase [Pseudomonadota bacterium]